MKGKTQSRYKYQCGGTLPANAPTYVEREADQQLLEMLENGEFCYVLNSRQMGKSSLRVRTMNKLQKEGFACAYIDLSPLGKNATADEWYLGIFDELVRKFNLSPKIQSELWWHQNGKLSLPHRLSRFIEEILLVEITSKTIVIFLDEIDSVLELSFNIADFFTLVRYCYNKRADNSDFYRLTFALFGVANPSDLIRDKKSTPFNIGQAIELTGFKINNNTEPLEKGLKDKTSNPHKVLREILYWTGGQPFLTQLICDLVVKSSFTIPEGKEVETIQQLVNKQVIESGKLQDEQVHFKYIRERIFNNKQNASKLLWLYTKILREQKVEADDSDEQTELRLSGLVVKEANILKVYNPIYKNFFNQDWVENELEKLRPHAYGKKIKAWLDSDKQDQSQLLYGDELRRLERWREEQRLGDHDLKFLGDSDKFDNRAQGFFARTINYETAIRRMLSWTNGRENLNESIFKIASNVFQSPKERGDAEWIDNLVRWHLIKDWKTHEQAKPLRKIRNYLLKNQNCDPFWLLFSYRQILQGISFNSSFAEHQELLKSGLVVNKDGELTVHNPIYEAIFDLSWVAKELIDLQPYVKEHSLQSYAEGLAAWLNSGCRDESTLLRGQVLQDSLASIKGQSLREEEEKFLITSQVVNLRVI
ncbi:MAG: hypothetical protein F6K47_23230 [Symploca sp. SIO2E6]|nr:hypothetical protein [Symploca sp. SIO2E6]